MNATELKPGDQVIYRAGTKCNDMKGTVVSREMDLGLGLGGDLKVRIRKRTRESEITANDITKKVAAKTKTAQSAVGDDGGGIEAKIVKTIDGREIEISKLAEEANQTHEQSNGQEPRGIRSRGDSVEAGTILRVREIAGPGDGQADLRADDCPSVRGQPSSEGPGQIVDGEKILDGGLPPGSYVDRREPNESVCNGIPAQQIGKVKCPHCGETFKINET